MLTSCTADSGTGPGESEAPRTPHASVSETSSAQEEKKLGDRARAAIEATASGEKLVESGLERVTDGAHTQPSFNKDKKYRLTVVCVGHGSVAVTFTPTVGIPKKTIACDESLASERFTVAETQMVRFDIVGGDGASGMVAWRIGEI
ncbi:hypothetical protein DVK44_17295 [Streptomyces paludis]|uniref:Uncharacterized protein n=1 Tax=Streptomyces paludis TaxID=2282738 RepID=A0A345HR13_9ACTN|nr:hypothetical protein DVK44_17295 [Streptomyces paludis]